MQRVARKRAGHGWGRVRSAIRMAQISRNFDGKISMKKIFGLSEEHGSNSRLKAKMEALHKKESNRLEGLKSESRVRRFSGAISREWATQARALPQAPHQRCCCPAFDPCLLLTHDRPRRSARFRLRRPFDSPCVPLLPPAAVDPEKLMRRVSIFTNELTPRQ